MANEFNFETFGTERKTPESAGGFNFETFGTEVDPKTLPKDVGFVQELARGFARPFLRTGVTAYGAGKGLVDLGQATVARFRGDKQGVIKNIQEAQQAVSTQPRRFGYLGEVSPITNAKEAIGTGLEIGATLAGPATALPKTALGKIAAGGVIGGLFSGGQAAELDQSAGEIAKQTALGTGLGAGTTAATLGISSLVKKFTEKGFQTLIKPSKVDIEDGFKVENIKKYNLGGPLHKMQEKTEAKIKGLATQLHDKLGDTDQIVDLNEIYAKTANDIGSSKGKLQHFGSNTRISTALNNLDFEIKNLENPILSIPDAQVVKQAAGSLGAWQFGKVDPDAIASEKIYNAFYRNLKTAIEKSSPEGVKGINKQLSELIPIQNAIIRRLPVAERNALLGLTDFIGLTASAFEPRALGITVLNVLSKSGTALNALSKTTEPVRRFAAPLGAGVSAVQSRFNRPNLPLEPRK